MYSIFYKRPTGEVVRINSEFQPKISSPYKGIICCEIEHYKILVSTDSFCFEYQPNKMTNYERQMEELLHGKE